MDKRIPEALIRKVWLDTTITKREAARIVGLSHVNLWLHAKRLGLPPRPTGRRVTLPRAPEIRVMWEAGVRCEEIAGVIGCHRMSVARLAREMGLSARAKGLRRISLEEFRAAEVLRQMADAAARENARMREWSR